MMLNKLIRFGVIAIFFTAVLYLTDCNNRQESITVQLNRGKYLVTSVLQCFNCHSPRDWNTPGAPPVDTNAGGGEIIWEDSTMRFIAPNISSDAKNGAGNWTDSMLIHAIRDGIGHDGRFLAPIMPAYNYRHLSEIDLAAVIAFVRTFKPVATKVLPTIVPEEQRTWAHQMLPPLLKPVAVPDTTDEKKMGEYLVQIGGCSGCHTVHGVPSPGQFAGGNLLEHKRHKAFTANITPGPSGINYGVNAFLFAMRTGKGATMSSIMPWITFKNMTDKDLKAIYNYLHSLPPVEHYINNQLPFSFCALCGESHGLGNRNVKKENKK